MSHSEGPWKVGPTPYEIKDIHQRPVATTIIYQGPEIEKANAILIAEAPTMKDALVDAKAIIEALISPNGRLSSSDGQARAMVRDISDILARIA